MPSDKIFVPYNEDTRHIYEAFAMVARQIEERWATDPEAAVVEAGMLGTGMK